MVTAITTATSFGDTPVSAPALNLPEPYASDLRSCIQVWAGNRMKHARRRAYYEGRDRLKNIGIAIPDELAGIEIVVGWPRKAVDELAKCSRFEKFATGAGGDSDALDRIAAENGLKPAYRRMLRSQLVNGLAFATVTQGQDGEPRARVRFYSAANASCLWDYRLGRIRCGLTVHDVDNQGRPTRYVLYEPDCVIEFSRSAMPYDGYWAYAVKPNPMGRPMMEPLAYNSDLDYPLGHSRITRAVMNITDRAVRESLRTELASEFAATPQKYLLGGTQADLEAATAEKTRWEMYIGSVQWITKDEDGDVPQYGQLPQVSMQPHMDYFEHLAEEFAAETDIPVDALVRSNTYTSADSATADRSALVQIAEDVNDDNGAALATIARMALAVDGGARLETVDEGIMPVFRSPDRASKAAQADWAVKMMSTFPFIADSDDAVAVMLEEAGFSSDQCTRIMNGKRRADATKRIQQMTAAAGMLPSAQPQQLPQQTQEQPQELQQLQQDGNQPQRHQQTGAEGGGSR